MAPSRAATLRRTLAAVWWALLPCLLCSLPAQAQKALDVAACAKCHAAQSVPQLQTPMGQAMQIHGHNPTLEAHPKLTFTAGKYTYTVATHAGVTQYTVTDGTDTISQPVQWTMGAKAQTWILQRDGKLYESLVSYYPAINGLDITTGDERLHPATLLEAMGRRFGDQDAKACFGCHATNAVAAHKLNLDWLQPGLTCEHCHTDAAAHLAHISRGDDSVLPRDLSALSSEDMSNFCGQCHRTWDTVVRSHWLNSSNVRFQPYRLANSRCFDGTDPRISCVACHNPHEDVKHDAAYYDTKCLACHSPAVTVSASNTIHAKPCPVANNHCASCHMPKVPLPNGHLVFTDHDIRVVKPGAPYPN